MALSSELISQFAKVTKDSKPTKSETTLFGTVVEDKDTGDKYVQLDGSDILTPVMATATYRNGERVSVMIKNHTAIVTGNITAPSASSADVDIIRKESGEAADAIAEFEILVSNVVSASEFYAEQARIDALVAEDIRINDKLTAAEADIDSLQSSQLVVTGGLAAVEADISKLYSEKVSADFVDATYATIESLDAVDADINALEATYAEFSVATVARLNAIEATLDSLDVSDFNAKYANINFSNIGSAAMEYLYSASGLIDNVVINNGTITGELVGVTLKGDLIEAGTVVADKLVVRGEDGLYYKLNADAGAVVTEDVTAEDLQNGLHGRVIIAKSITAEQISVDDLVAFGAKIGGLSITDKALYSGVKSSVDNTTEGLYFDSEGQMAVGNAIRYVKFYKDSTDGTSKLAIAADEVRFGDGSRVTVVPDSNGKPVLTLISENQNIQLRVSNSGVEIYENGNMSTYISNRMLNVDRVYAVKESQVGPFVTAERANGNVGERWIGGGNG